MSSFETYAASSRVIDDLLSVAERRIDVNTYEALLRDRFLVEEQVAAERRGRREMGFWRGSFEGRYTYAQRDEETEWSYKEGVSRIYDPLEELELAWARRIDRRLAKESDTPVLLFDFGGGLAHSLIRIAAQPQYSQAIQESRLLLVSSSLGEVPPDEPDQAGYTGTARIMYKLCDPEYNNNYMEYSRRELDFAQEHQRKITYIDATVTELESMTVTTPDGTAVPLVGNVESLHEYMAVLHSHIPGVAVAVLGRLLKKGGVMYLGTTRPHSFNTPDHEFTLEDGRVIRTDEPYHEQRRVDLAIGQAALIRYGVRRGKEWAYGPQEFTQQDGWIPGVMGVS